MSILLSATNIIKMFGDRKIFEIKNLNIYEGDKIGIVGLNGSGKTTLLNLLSGEENPDGGTIKRYCPITYLHQLGLGDGIANPKLLKELGLSDKTNREEISGGEQTRLRIAKALSAENKLLLADEPTSNLDMKGIEYFCEQLSGFGSYIIVSHDRNILNKYCNKIIEIKDARLLVYNGNYSFYKEQSLLDRKRQIQDYNEYRAEKEHLEKALTERDSKAKSIRKTPKRMGNSEARLHRRSATEKQEKINNTKRSIQTRLSHLERVEKPKDEIKIHLDFSLTNPPQNKIVISVKDLTFAYNENVIFKNASFDIEKNKKVAIYAPNGTGKTTLLNLIANRNPAVYIAPQGKIGYFYQGFEQIDMQKSILENAMKNSLQNEMVVRTILARLLFKRDDVYKTANVLSGGEKIRLSFAKLFVSSANILLLDEPTNYLDIPSLEILSSLLGEYEGTVLFVSHDREFINAVANKLLIIQNKTVNSFQGNLKDLELKETEKQKDKNSFAKNMLKMKLAQIAEKISRQTEDKEVLEAEYKEISEKIKELDI